MKKKCKYILLNLLILILNILCLFMLINYYENQIFNFILVNNAHVHIKKTQYM